MFYRVIATCPQLRTQAVCPQEVANDFTTRSSFGETALDWSPKTASSRFFLPPIPSAKMRGLVAFFFMHPPVPA